VDRYELINPNLTKQKKTTREKARQQQEYDIVYMAETNRRWIVVIPLKIEIKAITVDINTAK